MQANQNILEVDNDPQSVASTEETLKNAHEAIWPDYFPRMGQPDSTTWHYQGHLSDTRRVWLAYYGFLAKHPLITWIGSRQFFQNLIYRVFGSTVGDQTFLTITIITPFLALFLPVFSLVAVSIAKLPRLQKLTPPLFQPFTLLGWSNYCIMLALVFSWHGYRQSREKLHPLQCLQHSSKVFWNDFFRDHLPRGHRTTHQLSRYRNGAFNRPIPKENLIIKPEYGGAGYKLRSFKWDEEARVYRCHDSERCDGEPSVVTPHELALLISSDGSDFVIERWEKAREPLPTSTLRILTVNFSGKSELLSGAFLVAPAGSVSTAYFDLDGYLIDFSGHRIGEAFRINSDSNLGGTLLPELDDVVSTCIALHDRLPGHVEISWDIMLTEDGPVFLEGNVFPPGCDYKLSIFKNDANLAFLKSAIFASHTRRSPFGGAK
jgi:hypothetical protein